MPTIPLLPQANGRFTGWSSIVGAIFAWQAIDDSTDGSHDSAATYIVLPRLIGSQGIVSFPMWNQCEGFAPASITLRVVAQRGGAAHPLINVGFARGGIAAFSATQIDAPVSWGATEIAFSTNPLTSQPWTEDDLDGLEACLQSDPLSIGTNQITLFTGSMTYQGSRFFARAMTRPTQV